ALRQALGHALAELPEGSALAVAGLRQPLSDAVLMALLPHPAGEVHGVHHVVDFFNSTSLLRPLHFDVAARLSNKAVSVLGQPIQVHSFSTGDLASVVILNLVVEEGPAVGEVELGLLVDGTAAGILEQPVN